jgi:hypothetical protein
MSASAAAADTSFRLGRLNRSVKDPIPYSREALRQDLTRVRNAWDDCQASRDRNAIYGYLTAVFDLVMWWAAENCALARARKALRLQNIWPSDHDEPFAAIILCTADPAKVDKRTRSKWSRVLRYAAQYKTNAEPFAGFVRRKGGINKCASRFTPCLERRTQRRLRYIHWITRTRPENTCSEKIKYAKYS